MGADGAGLSCPGSGEVARMDIVGRRDFTSGLDTETIERYLDESEEHAMIGWMTIDADSR